MARSATVSAPQTPPPASIQAHGSLASFQAHNDRSELSQGRKDQYRTILTRYGEFFNDRDPAAATWEDVDAFRAALRATKLRDDTIGWYLTGVNAYHNHLVGLRVRLDNPVQTANRMRRRAGVKGKQIHKRVPPLQDVFRMLDACDTRAEFCTILMLAKTGERIDELATTTPNMITWTGPDRGRYVLRPHPKRSNTCLWLDEETMQHLDVLLKEDPPATPQDPLIRNRRGGPISADTVDTTLLRRVCNQLGLVQDWKDPTNRITAHCFRYVFTSHMSRAGMPDELVEEYRGDLRRGRTRDGYRLIEESELREAYNQYVWKLPPELLADS